MSAKLRRDIVRPVSVKPRSVPIKRNLATTPTSVPSNHNIMTQSNISTINQQPTINKVCEATTLPTSHKRPRVEALSLVNTAPVAMETNDLNNLVNAPPTTTTKSDNLPS